MGNDMVVASVLAAHLGYAATATTEMFVRLQDFEQTAAPVQGCAGVAWWRIRDVLQLNSKVVGPLMFAASDLQWDSSHVQRRSAEAVSQSLGCGTNGDPAG